MSATAERRRVGVSSRRAHPAGERIAAPGHPQRFRLHRNPLNNARIFRRFRARNALAGTSALSQSQSMDTKSSPHAFAYRVLGFALVLAAAVGQPALAQSAETPTPRSVLDRLSPEVRAHHEANAIRLWAGRAPQARGDTPADTPLLYPVLPETAGAEPRPVMLVLPGGGYNHHSAGEGLPVAEWFRDAGFASFVLTYRLQPYTPDEALVDVQRAVRVLRSRAAELNLDPARIGVVGFSAGGHLAANLSTHGDEGRPDDADPVERFGCRIRSAILFYPAILRTRITRAPETPGRELCEVFEFDGLHRLVDARTPPTFLIVGYDDASVPYEHCLAYAARLHAAGVRFELHVLGAGGHGGSVREQRRAQWEPLVRAWLATSGLMSP